MSTRILVAGLAAALLFPATANALELRLATIAPPSHVWVVAAEQFQKELAARPELDLTVAIFPVGQLGGEPETLQQIESGLLDMGAFTLAALTTRDQGFNGWFTPYLFEDVEAATKARELPAAREMLDSLRQHNMIGLDYYFAGMRHILSRSIPIDSADDLRDQKVRITPFDAMQTWWVAMGAVPTPMPLGGVYQALQTGVIDVIDIDLDAAVSFGMQEVAQHLALTSHMAFPGAIVISEATWDRLSEEQQEGLVEALTTSVEFANELQIEREETNIEFMADHVEVTRIEDAEEAFAPANTAFEENFMSIPLVAAFVEQVENMASE